MGKTPRLMSLLFGRKCIDPTRADNEHRTLLLLAAENGRDGAAKLLLERGDVCSERADNLGRAPLSWDDPELG